MLHSGITIFLLVISCQPIAENVDWPRTISVSGKGNATVAPESI